MLSLGLYIIRSLSSFSGITYSGIIRRLLLYWALHYYPSYFTIIEEQGVVHLLARCMMLMNLRWGWERRLMIIFLFLARYN